MKKLTETRICKHCGKPFHPNYGRPGQVFCSTDCYLQNRWGDRSINLCPVCGKPATSTGKRNQVYCSWKCAQEGKNGRKNPGRSNLVTKPCDWCGEPVTRPASNFHSNKVFCNYRCMAEWQSEFVVKDAHPRWKGGAPRSYGIGWKNARKEAMERANGICERCGNRKAVEVHHRIPVRYFNPIKLAHDSRNLIAVCGICHRTEHRELARFLPFMDTFLDITKG